MHFRITASQIDYRSYQSSSVIFLDEDQLGGDAAIFREVLKCSRAMFRGWWQDDPELTFIEPEGYEPWKDGDLEVEWRAVVTVESVVNDPVSDEWIQTGSGYSGTIHFDDSTLNTYEMDIVFSVQVKSCD